MDFLESAPAEEKTSSRPKICLSYKKNSMLGNKASEIILDTWICRFFKKKKTQETPIRGFFLYGVAKQQHNIRALYRLADWFIILTNSTRLARSEEAFSTSIWTMFVAKITATLIAEDDYWLTKEEEDCG